MQELPSMNELGMSCVLLNPCPNPQELIYYAMHRCYSEEPLVEQIARGDFKGWNESKFGEAVVKHLLSGNRGHFGPLEEGHQFMFAVDGAVHNLVMQLRTHRIGISFDVQSQRYTSQNVIDVALGIKPVEEVFYFRPLGYEYTNREGKRYTITEDIDKRLKGYCINACDEYRLLLEYHGFSEEHARDYLPQGIRQNFTFSANVRTLLHLDNVRNKLDVQMELRVLMRHINNIMSEQCPEIYAWQNTKSKRMLSA
jgi:thymidylate synthase (FAD)